MITVTHAWQFVLWIGFYSELAHFLLGVLVALPVTLIIWRRYSPAARSFGAFYILLLLSALFLGAASHYLADWLQPWF